MRTPVGTACRSWAGGPLRLVIALAVITLFAASAEGAAGLSFGPYDVRSVFHVAKSENMNQVHYAVRLDGSCHPRGSKPVFAYWRRTRGHGYFDAPLTGMGSFVYGASDDQIVKAAASGSRVEFYVKALQRVRIEVEIRKTPNGCESDSFTSLRGARMRLSHAFVQLGGFANRVRWVDLVGYRENGARVNERLRPQ
jgi:hypothetical protein